VQSSTVVMGDRGDAVWDNSIPSNNPSYDRVRFNTEFVVDDSQKHLIVIELWKSFMAIFDNKVAYCPVNIEPILEYSDEEIERWFPLNTVDGKAFGNILVRFSCTSKANDLDLFGAKADASERLITKSPKIEEQHEMPVSIVLPPHPQQGSLPEADPVGKSYREKSHEMTSDSSNSKNEVQLKASAPGANPKPSSAETTLFGSFLPITASPSKKTPRTDQLSARSEDDFDAYHETFSSESLNPEPSLKSLKLSAGQDHHQRESGPPSTPDKKAVDKTNEIVSTQTPRILVTTAVEAVKVENKPLFSDVMTKSLTEWQKYLQVVGNTAYGYVDSIIYDSKVKKDESIEDIKQSFVGHIYVDLTSAYKYDVADAGQGNHFIIATIDDSTKQELRTKTIHNSATPIFNARWIFTVPHFRSVVKLSFMESLPSEKKIGESLVSVYSLIQAESDAYFSGSTRIALEKNRQIPIYDINDKSKAIGYFDARITFKEDVQGLYLDYYPRIAASGPQEALSVERLTIHIARFQAIVDLVSNMMTEYQKIVEWDDVVITLICVTLFLYACLKINAEYALCCPFFVVVFLLTTSMLRRRSGAFKMSFIDIKKKKKKKQAASALSYDDDDLYQPYAIARIAVLRFRRTGNLPEPQQGQVASANSSSSSSNSSAVSAASAMSISAFSGGYFTGAGGTHSTSTSKKNAPVSLSSLSKSSIRLSYVAMNTIPIQGFPISANKSSNATDMLSEPREFLIGILRSTSHGKLLR
jgi:hypothetical protein